MPRIFDNIDLQLLPALTETLAIADRADFCIGYLNLRGWRLLAPTIDRWAGGAEHCCRVLVGMQRLPQDEWRVRWAIHRRRRSLRPRWLPDNTTLGRWALSLGGGWGLCFGGCSNDTIRCRLLVKG